MAGHDLGLGLADGDLHVVGLRLGLLAEDGQRGLVALLLGGGVRHLVGLERQVGVDGDHDGADADALRSVDSLVHYNPLSVQTGPLRPGITKSRRPRVVDACSH